MNRTALETYINVNNIKKRIQLVINCMEPLLQLWLAVSHIVCWNCSMFQCILHLPHSGWVLEKKGSGSIYRSHHKGVGHGAVGPVVKKKWWRKRVPDDAECKTFSEVQELTNSIWNKKGFSIIHKLVTRYSALIRSWKKIWI